MPHETHHGGSYSGVGPGGRERLWRGHHLLQYGVIPIGCGQRLPRRGQSPRGHPHHGYGQPHAPICDLLRGDRRMDARVRPGAKGMSLRGPRSPFAVRQRSRE